MCVALMSNYGDFINSKKKRKKKAMTNRKYQRPKNRGLQNSKQKNKFTKKKN